MEKGDVISRSAVLDAMPKSDVLLRYQVVDVICNSPSIDVVPVITGETEAGVPKWISVEERLPEHGTDVLVLTAPGALSLGRNCVVAEYIHPRMEKSGVFINFYAGYDDKNILAATHWMPLPELPKEDENED